MMLRYPTLARTSPSALFGNSNTPLLVPPANASPATGPSGMYGIRGATGSPSAFFGMAPRPHPVARLAPPAPAAPGGGNPYAPQTDAQLNAQVKAEVAAQTNPIIKQLTDAINSRAAAAQAAISGYTAQFAPALQQLAGIGTAGLQTAQQSQAATDAALAQALTGGGTQAAQELGAKLNAINAPNADQLSQQAAQEGAGAGNAALAQGSAALSAINAQLATAQDAATKQPGIAALFGGQASRDLQAQASQNIADQTGQVAAQVPGLVSTLTTDALNRRDAKTTAARSTATSAYNAGLISQRDLGNTLGLPNWQSLPDTRKGVSSTAAPKTIGNSQTGFYQYDPKTGGWGQVVAPAAGKGAAAHPFTIRPGDTVEVPDGKGGYTAYSAPAAPKDPKAPVTKSTPNGTFQWDPQTKTWSKIPGTAPAAKPPSAADAKSGLAALASAGGVNWKTGQMTPTFRKAAREYITQTTGTDPGPIPSTATPEQLARLQKTLNVAPAAAKAPPAAKITGTSPSDKYTVVYNPDGTVKSVAGNRNYKPPTAKATPPAKIDLALSKAARRWVDSSGNRVTGTGLPPAPPKPAASFKRLAPADIADSARDAYNGIPDNIVKVIDKATGKVVAKNEPIPPRSYDDAFREIVLHGGDPDMVKKALNNFYKPGQRGRPATTTDYLKDSAVFWQRDEKGNIVAYRRFTNKQTGQQRRQAIGIVSPQDPNYKAARARALALAS